MTGPSGFDSDASELASALAARRASGLRRFLCPSHIVLVGGTEAARAAEQCARIGFQGPIWAVHPVREALGGLPCYRRVDELPEGPDAAFVAVPPAAAIETVGALSALGCGGALVHTSGFAEVGAQGVALQAELVAAAGDMPIVGPNCWGLINYLDKVALWPDRYGGNPNDSGVAIISQSGNLAINLSMQDRSLRLAYLLSVGNQAQTSVSELLEVMVGDPRVSAIGLLLEGLPDVGAFEQAVFAARRQAKPVVVLKVGRSQLGAAVAFSHTASLTGDDACYQALFDRLGVARVYSQAAFVECLKLLDVAGPLPGRRVLSMSCSGGEAAMVADAAQDLGVKLPALDEVEAQTLGRLAQLDYPASNPFDYHTYVWGKHGALKGLFGAAAQVPVDVCMLALDLPRGDSQANPDAWLNVADAFCTGVQGVASLTGIVVSGLPECLPSGFREDLIARGVVPMQGIDDALRAVAAAAFVGESWAQPVPPRLRRPLAPLVVSEGHRHAAANDGGRQPEQLDEWSAKQLLSAAGVAVPTGELVASEDVLEAGARIGYPVVLKRVSAEIAHKTEAGAVAIGLADETALARAKAHMLAEATPSECTEAAPLQFLVERQVSDVIAELLVGVRADPQFGLVMALGAGGTLVELLGDVRLVLLPVAPKAVEVALGQLKLAPLLHGYRGRPGADMAAVVEAICSVAEFALGAVDCLLELDVNPLLVSPHGVFAADAFIRFRPSASSSAETIKT